MSYIRPMSTINRRDSIVRCLWDQEGQKGKTKKFGRDDIRPTCKSRCVKYKLDTQRNETEMIGICGEKD